jgi:2'-5' RNA ligase
MTIWTGSSYVFFGVEGPLVEALDEFRYDFDDNFHMTTHFLGKEPLDNNVAVAAITVVRTAANHIEPFTLRVEKFATFGPPTAPARVARFKASEWVYRWRKEVEHQLDRCGVTVSKTWLWEPHMTYAYGFDPDILEPMEDQLTKRGLSLEVTSLQMYDGRAKLVVPL